MAHYITAQYSYHDPDNVPRNTQTNNSRTSRVKITQSLGRRSARSQAEDDSADRLGPLMSQSIADEDEVTLRASAGAATGWRFDNENVRYSMVPNIGRPSPRCVEHVLVPHGGI